MREISLIKKNISLFEKIKNLFRSLFNIEKDTNAKEDIDIKQTTSLIEEVKNKQAVMILQQDYENGKIVEDDINEEEKQKLLELYQEQIKTLNDNINVYKNLLKNYKEKILTIRKSEI